MTTPGEEQSPGRGVAGKLAALARRDYEFGMLVGDEPYAVLKEGPRLARLFRGRSAFRSVLTYAYEREYGSLPSQNAMADVLMTLEGEARAGSAPPQELPLRVAWNSWDEEGYNLPLASWELVLDLGDEQGHAIVLRADGWRALKRSPLMFLRSGLVRALPEPERGGSLKEHLYPHLNIAAADRKLLVAVVLSWLWPDIDHPVAFLWGPEGSGKSTVTRMLRGLVDPSVVSTRRVPAKDDDWEVTIAGQWVVAINNMSHLPDWLSDAICTAVDGTAGDVKRKKFSDQDLSALQVRRCVLLNSIDRMLISRGDLADRAIPFECLPLARTEPEDELAARWKDAKPLALGALLDLACKVLGVLQSGNLRADRLGDFRLGGFAKVAAAVDQVAPGGGSALGRYRQLLAESVADAVDHDPLSSVLAKLAERPGGWRGTASDLHSAHRPPGTTDEAWPKNPAELSKRLARLTGTLLKAGVSVEARRDRNGRFLVVGRVTDGRT